MTLWERLARVFSRRDAGVREEAERILLEADFGVAATAEILEQVARVPDGDLQPPLEQAVGRLRPPAAPFQSDPGGPTRAPEPPRAPPGLARPGARKTPTTASPPP